jgi:hypothetical protein
MLSGTSTYGEDSRLVPANDWDCLKYIGQEGPEWGAEGEI